MAAHAEEPQQQPQPPESSQSAFHDAFTTRRSLRQLGLFVAGATFFTGAQLLTRRALARRYKLPKPPFYHPSNVPYQTGSGAMDALEAFNLATVNVVSAAIMLTGGAMWATDISTLEDLRGKVKHRVGSGDAKKSDEEIEEWIAEVLARKDMKEAVKAATGIQLEQIIADAKTKEDGRSSEGPAR
ncbi:uncharacterized protein LTHEOB_8735 [Lasiodiplodia theobromae]|uniref:Altered inheritance of mitochondria protein 11 n=1 Tax=Lasiodiplodia theobromae TaxID=45133 RepID=A0A5N5D567_9PEZI|nr:uncharacterized protein LTHEOB_8735 [Lasiodiplodia theobromae]KAB2572751.1 hypothetical protein DBV05_g8577 [Lasiodiplodia theobromae]KAF4541339.1 hypothetical protein LTHEOB_8735 [Lasiodiplodia theobromae]